MDTRVFLLLLGASAVTKAVEVTFGYEDPSQNMIANWNFDKEISSKDWGTEGATAARVQGGMGGGWCLRVTNRRAVTSQYGTNFGSIHQTVPGILPNRFYYVSAHVKILNNPTSSKWVMVIGKPKIFYNDGSSKSAKGGRLSFVRQSNTWLQVGADFKTDSKSVKHISYTIQVEPKEVNFEIDTVSLILLKRESNWKTLLNNDIAKYRKNSVTVSGSLSSGINLSQTQIKFEMQSNEFGIGTAVQANYFNGESTTEKNYRNFILKNFNWCVLENDMKWKPMEKVKGSIRYERVDKALATMKANGIKIRGHAGTWDIKKTNPLWVQPLKGQTLKNEIDRRLNYMFTHYKNKIFEWDVCNEYTHQHFYEDSTNNLQMLEYQFDVAKRLDPNADLCLNDYELLRGGGMQGSNNVNIAKYLKSKGKKINCIGAQAHLKQIPVTPESLKQRLKVITSIPGVYVTLSELSLHTPSDNLRAEAVDTVLRTAFANPKVRGCVFWGFSDVLPSFARDMFLTKGQSMAPNAAGKKLQHLIHNEWSTKETIPAGKSVSKTFSAFRGDYKLTVTVGGVVKLEKNFKVGKGANNINFSV